MTQTLKVLGQSAPAATTLTDFYTVPGATTTSVSTISVANTSSSADTFRVSVAIGGAANNVKQYLYYDITIPGNNTFMATVGLSLGTGDVLRCYSGSGNCSFQAFGAENS